MHNRLFESGIDFKGGQSGKNCEVLEGKPYQALNPSMQPSWQEQVRANVSPLILSHTRLLCPQHGNRCLILQLNPQVIDDEYFNWIHTTKPLQCYTGKTCSNLLSHLKSGHYLLKFSKYVSHSQSVQNIFHRCCFKPSYILSTCLTSGAIVETMAPYFTYGGPAQTSLSFGWTLTLPSHRSLTTPQLSPISWPYCDLAYRSGLPNTMCS